MNMLEHLFQIEQQLPRLIREREHWHSVFVDYHTPFVERLWRLVGDYRLYLHRIHPCPSGAALFHPHPWPSAMRIVSGTYEMGVGYGSGMTPPPCAATLLLPAGTSYEMTDPDGWHYVRPLDVPSLSLMITRKPWHRPSPRSTTQLAPLSPAVQEELFAQFLQSYSAKKDALY